MLEDRDGCLIEAAAVVVGDDRVVISGEVERGKRLARRGVHERGECGGGDLAVAFNAERADAELLAFRDVVDDLERSRVVNGSLRTVG